MATIEHPLSAKEELFCSKVETPDENGRLPNEEAVFVEVFGSNGKRLEALRTDPRIIGRRVEVRRQAIELFVRDHLPLSLLIAKIQQGLDACAAKEPSLPDYSIRKHYIELALKLTGDLQSGASDDSAVVAIVVHGPPEVGAQPE